MKKFTIQTFIPISTKLCLDACHLLNKAYQNQNLKKFNKSFNNPVTQADYKVQAALQNGFKQFFPFIPIIGQEDLDKLSHMQIEKDQQIMESHLLSFPNKIFSNDSQLALQKEILEHNYRSGPCIWIDPLDCTRGFINNYAEDVTVLIGLSIGKKAKIGLIGTPFKRTAYGELIFDPSITIGCVDLKQAYIYTPSQSNQWKKLDNPYQNSTYQQNSIRKVASSVLKTSNRQKSIVSSLGAETIRAGGSGRKINMVANKIADLMLFIDSYTGKWDSCAGEAVIKSLGGIFTNYLGQQLEYDHEKVIIYGKQYALNKKGMICSLDKQIHYQALELIRKYDQVQKRFSYKFENQLDSSHHLWEHTLKLQTV